MLSKTEQDSIIRADDEWWISGQSATHALGSNFIAPWEIERAHQIMLATGLGDHKQHFQYPESARQLLKETLPSHEVCQTLAEKGFVLVPGPPVDMNIVEMKEAMPWLFYMNERHGNVDVWNQWFSCKDVYRGPQWLALREHLIAGTKTHVAPQVNVKNVPPGEYLPQVIEFVWVMCMFALVRDKRLYPEYVITADMKDPKKGTCRITTGGFTPIGFSISYYLDHDRWRKELGLATGIKL